MTLRKDVLTARRPAFHAADVVRLTRDFAAPDCLIPRGTEATILQVFGAGEAYQVEFECRHDTPETVPATALEAVLALPA